MSNYEAKATMRRQAAQQYRHQDSQPSYESINKIQKKSYEPYGKTKDLVVDTLVNHQAATLAYVHTLLNPAADDDTGISILPGGFTPTSTVIQLRATQAFNANANGEAWARVYGSAEVSPEIEGVGGFVGLNSYRRGPSDSLINPIAVVSGPDALDSPPVAYGFVSGPGAPPGVIVINVPQSGIAMANAEFDSLALRCWYIRHKHCSLHKEQE